MVVSKVKRGQQVMHYQRARIRLKLSDQVAKDIRFDILRGKLLPGTHIVERSIAADLGVSNGPVREAIMRLENEGFVTTQSNGRTLVNDITREFIDEYIDLSCYLFRTCVKSIIREKSNGRNIDSLLEDLEESLTLLSESIRKNDNKGITTADNNYTTSIVWASNNRVNRNIWLVTDGIREGLYSVTELYYQNALESHKNSFYKNLQQLKKAIHNSDYELAKTCIEQHYRFRRTACLHFIEERESKALS